MNVNVNIFFQNVRRGWFELLWQDFISTCKDRSIRRRRTGSAWQAGWGWECRWTSSPDCSGQKHTGVQKSFDVLPSWADPGSCAPSAYVMIFWTVATVLGFPSTNMQWISLLTAGALRIGSPRDFRPTVQPSTYSFWAFEPVYTKAFRPVSGSMLQSMVK